MVANKKSNVSSENNHYEIFRENLKNMKPVTDSKPPKLKVPTYLKIANIAQDKAALKSNLKANFEMLRTVNVIQRTTGFVDNHLAQPIAGHGKAEAKKKIKTIRAMEKSNRELLKKFNGMVIEFLHQSV